MCRKFYLFEEDYFQVIYCHVERLPFESCVPTARASDFSNINCYKQVAHLGQNKMQHFVLHPGKTYRTIIMIALPVIHNLLCLFQCSIKSVCYISFTNGK